MTFDTRATVYAAQPQVPSQVEQFQGGDRNSWNNCVPTSCMLGHAAYGAPAVDPQRETDAVYGAAYVGGEAFWAAEDWIARNVSDTPGHTYGGGQTGDLAGIDAHGSAGQYLIGFFNCTSDATIVGYTTGLYHASPIVAHDDGGWTVLNVHDYSEQHFTDAELNAAMSGAGGWVYYEAALPQEDQMTPEEKAEFEALKADRDHVLGAIGTGDLGWSPTDHGLPAGTTIAEVIFGLLDGLGSWDAKAMGAPLADFVKALKGNSGSGSDPAAVARLETELQKVRDGLRTAGS